MEESSGPIMPKEQPSSSRSSPSTVTTSCPSAKDQSGSTAAAVASRNTKDTSNRSGSGPRRRCSEKDSGYSEGSDWQQTDAEDQHGNKSDSRGSETTETSQSDKSQEHEQGNPGNSSVVPARPDLPTIFILKNILKQQPDTIQKRGQLLWRNPSPDMGGSSAPHMILCPQRFLLPAALRLHKPSNVKGKKTNSSYFPIFSSYPRIAPHPSKKPPDKTSANDESQSKRVCTERKSESTAGGRILPKQHLTASASGPSCSSTTADPASPSSSTASSSQSSQPTPISSSSSLANQGLRANGATSNHRRRFLNTVEVLRRSGLLALTLRTKELLRQSNATDLDIAQLRRHTELLCQAADGCGQDGSSPAWERPHRAMAESANYPDLKLLQELQNPSLPDSSAQPESVTTGDANGPPRPHAPPCHLLSALLHPKQNCAGSQQTQSEPSREAEPAEMSTDSSAG